MAYRDLRLALKLPHEFRVLGVFGSEQFQRDEAVQIIVHRLVNKPLPAMSEDFHQFVVPEFPPYVNRRPANRAGSLGENLGTRYVKAGAARWAVFCL